MARLIRTLLPMAADGVGPSFTCVSLLAGAERNGTPVELYVNRYSMQTELAGLHVLLGGMLGKLPYKLVHRSASRELERRYVARARAGDIAYLWPGVSLATHERMKALGLPVVLEGINTRMKFAKALLDEAYEAFGAPAGHGITEERVQEEEAKYDLADAIFAPSPGVEAALAGSALATKFISCSYGVDTARPGLEPAERRQTDRVSYIFCGYACVRKGIHHLLDIWPMMPENATLRIVGKIEPVIAQRFSELLSGDRVEMVGFSRSVHEQYARSDVFVLPSLEEGDPLVTYEAALHGLPIVASKMGAGRMGAASGCARIVEPGNGEALLSELLEVHRSRELRQDLGARARAAVPDYDWTFVAGSRMQALQGLLP